MTCALNIVNILDELHTVSEYDLLLVFPNPHVINFVKN